MVLMLLIKMFIYFHVCDGLIEFVKERGPQDREFRLTCRELTSHIAIMEASFTPVIVTEVNNDTFGARIFNVTTTQIIDGDFNVRLALNQRCSGKNHCSFILQTDNPLSKYWGPGEIYIKYACMPEAQVTKFCNSDIKIPEGGGIQAQGFITTPGYPKFYIGQSECRWKIKAPVYQRIELTLLDVSLSEYETDYPTNCEDELFIFNDDITLVNTCTVHEKARVILSESNTVQINVIGKSESLIPKRGILIYYRALECPTLPPPIDGYLVHRNITAAEYMCCVGYVFPDTLERTKVLKCIHNFWDKKLPEECIHLSRTSTTTPPIDRTTTTLHHSKMSEGSHLIDVVIPSLLIAGLLIGNAIVVFIIYKYKKRKTLHVQEEELNTMVSNNVP